MEGPLTPGPAMHSQPDIQAALVPPFKPRSVACYGELIESIDISPLLVGECGCIAVDALVVPRMQTDFKSEEVA